MKNKSIPKASHPWKKPVVSKRRSKRSKWTPAGMAYLKACKERRVLVILELRTGLSLGVLRNKDLWHGAGRTCLQAQANVYRVLKAVK